MDVIPKGDWFCYDCKPREPPPTLRVKKRRLVDEDDILDELDQTDSDEDVGRSGRRGGGRRSNENTEETTEEELCAICNFAGELTTCEWCSNGYHPLCLIPPLNRTPRGSWLCPDCKSDKPGSSSKSRKKSRPRPRPTPSRRRRIIDDDEESDEDEQRNGTSDVDEATTEEENSSDEAEPVKVRFGRQGTSVNSARAKRTYEDDDDYVDSEEERHHANARGSRRKCASQAAAKIAQVAKRLRSDSKENESSENSNDSSSSGFGIGIGSRKRDHHGDGYEGPEVSKRTRLQRMNTNNCVRNGELDNVLLDKALSEVMKQNEAWAFLKPVTRQEAPDYHDIVKHPMDLGTIKYKLNSMVYTCNEEFISDLLLVFSNCEAYNPPTTRIFLDGQKLKTFCERRFSKIGILISDS
jgi:bromodomain adjacent to zinc finger domain protein 1A